MRTRLWSALFAFILIIFSTESVRSGSAPPQAPEASETHRVNISNTSQTAEIVAGKIAVNSSLKKEVAALDYIKSQPKLFKLKEPSNELRLESQTTDKLGMSHLRFDQTFENLPVWGCRTIVHFDTDGDIYLVGGQTIPTPELNTNPSLPEYSATNRAREFVRDRISGAEYDLETELLIFPDSATAHLCWQVTLENLKSHPFRWRIFVDAHTGEILNHYNDLPDADWVTVGYGTGVTGDSLELQVCKIGSKYRMVDASRPMYQPPIRDYRGTINTYYERDPYDWLVSEADSVFDVDDSIKAAVSGHNYMGQTYDYFLTTFGRDSYDGNGSSINVTVHQDVDLNNAYYMGGGNIYFGSGDGVRYLPWSGALDIVAHEFTHGVTTSSAGLIYEFASGALSESYSDFFGAMVDRDDWTICEDIALYSEGFLRSMIDPHLGAFPDKFPFGYQPSHMSEYIDTIAGWDNGAVHHNSGIPNRVGYLVADAIDRDKAEQIWYRTLTTYLTPNSSFAFWGDMTIRAAIDLYGEAAEAAAIESALEIVGIGTGLYTIPDEMNWAMGFEQFKSFSFELRNPSADPIEILSLSNTEPLLSMISSFPQTIPDRGNITIDLEFDATGISSCELTTYYDTLVLTTNSITTPEMRIPVEIGVRFVEVSPNFSLNSHCGIGIAGPYTGRLRTLFGDSYDALYDASLLIGIREGIDTTVYRHVHQEESLQGKEMYYRWSVANPFQRQVKMSIVTADARIQGHVTYTSGGVDLCGFFVADYTLFNSCDTALEIITGLYADFDATESYDSDIVGIDSDYNLIYTANENHALALAVPGVAPRNLRNISNPDDIWPTSNLETGFVYGEMESVENYEGSGANDWSELATFGIDTLGPGDTLTYRAYFLYSITGVPGLYDILDATNFLYLPDTIIQQAAYMGANPPDQRLVVDYYGMVPGTWSSTHASSWLSVSAESGATGDSVGLSYDITGLTPGKYLDTIVVYCESAQNSVDTVIIELRINPGTGVVMVPSPNISKIQTAVDIAFEGDTVLVGPGTYTEYIRCTGKAVKIVSLAGPEQTIITPPPYLGRKS